MIANPAKTGKHFRDVEKRNEKEIEVKTHIHETISESCRDVNPLNKKLV